MIASRLTVRGFGHLVTSLQELNNTAARSPYVRLPYQSSNHNNCSWCVIALAVCLLACGVRELRGLGFGADWASDIGDLYGRCTAYIFDMYTTHPDGSAGGGGGGGGVDAEIKRVMSEQQAQISALTQQVATLEGDNADLIQRLRASEAATATAGSHATALEAQLKDLRAAHSALQAEHAAKLAASAVVPSSAIGTVPVRYAALAGGFEMECL